MRNGASKGRLSSDRNTAPIVFKEDSLQWRITINKSQGQISENIGIYLVGFISVHEQIYVAK
jgi:hypothetical protein